MNDTPPEVAKIVRQKVLARSPAERLAMGAAMFDAAREMVLASLPKNLPSLELRRQHRSGFTGKRLPFDFEEVSFVPGFIENLRYAGVLAACSRTCWMWTSTCLRKDGETA